MTKSTPTGPQLAPEDLLIEIDPGLIEEALAAVERNARSAAEPRVGPVEITDDDASDPGDEIELALEPTTAPLLADDERRRLQFRLREQQETIRRLERAWLHAVSDPAQILGGLQMIVEQFKRLLGRLGFERVEAERGTLFDPTQHEAVLHVHDDGVLPGTIVDEVHAGFRLRGRLFRPARVTVSAPPKDERP